MKSTRAGLYSVILGVLLVMASPDSPAGVMDAGKPARVNVNQDPAAVTPKPTSIPFGLKPVSSAAALEVQQFKWEEFGDDGGRLLQEKGSLFGALILLEQARGPIEVRERIRVFGGSVDYDGSTWEGVPEETDVGYLGVGLGMDGGYRVAFSKTVSAKLLAGLDSRLWQRDIKSREDVQGYKEFWMVLQGRVGGGLDVKWPQGIALAAEACAALPLGTYESVDLYDGVDLRPGQKTTLGAEVRLTWKQLVAAAYVEGLEFDKSDSVSRRVADDGMVYNLDLFQPKSEAHIAGLYIGYKKHF